jgi:transcriptional regulator with XRE-family HTH domain
MNLETEIRMAVAKAGQQKAVAMKLGISESELSRKINGERGWKLGELQKLFDICGLRISNGNDDKEGFDAVHILSKELAKTMDELKALKKNGGKI